MPGLCGRAVTGTTHTSCNRNPVQNRVNCFPLSYWRSSTMPINRPQPPVSALAALIDGLAAFLSDEDHEKAREIVRGGRAVAAPEIPSAAKLGFQPGKLTVPIADYNPIEVFALSIDNVMRGLPLRSAVSSAGWRFFVSQPGSNHVVMAWVFQQPPAGAWKIAAVFYGPEVARLKDVSNGLDRYENAGD